MPNKTLLTALLSIFLVLAYVTTVEAQRRGPRGYYSNDQQPTTIQQVPTRLDPTPPPVSDVNPYQAQQNLDPNPDKNTSDSFSPPPTEQDNAQQQDDNACKCPTNESLVCGSDGKTYKNSCFAYCAGVAINKYYSCERLENQKAEALEEKKKQLEDQCICTQEYDPVCSTRGVTYSNPCLAQCVNAKIAYTGRCGSANDKRSTPEKVKDAAVNDVVDKLF